MEVTIRSSNNNNTARLLDYVANNPWLSDLFGGVALLEELIHREWLSRSVYALVADENTRRQHIFDVLHSGLFGDIIPQEIRSLDLEAWKNGGDLNWGLTDRTRLDVYATHTYHVPDIEYADVARIKADLSLLHGDLRRELLEKMQELSRSEAIAAVNQRGDEIIGIL